ncbi:MAG: hypothetical protein JSV39_03560 [Candidatus Aenigmatarchaeota archaeon]|nr:MAG: hypothetical protein JSV39_03560 [Candidatus Aenigmarchaeota archaeon]
MRKVQAQAITLVLISGIVISLVGFAYSWGRPMIDKRSVITQFTSSVRFMEDLDSKIVDMAGTCSSTGACEESFDLPVPGLIRLDESANTIIYEFQVNQPLVDPEGEVLFNTMDNGTLARYGETPGVISLSGKATATGTYMLRFSLRYRELDSDEPWRGYKIQLKESGADSGNNKIFISYDGSETQSGGAVNGGDLIISKIKVQIT